MSTRHAWIVYPLLFLALGAALRDKFIPPSLLKARAIAADELSARAVAVERLRCGQLEAANAQCVLARVQALGVTGPDGAERARLVVLPNQGGQLVLCGRDGKPVLLAGADDSGGSGVLKTVTAGGRPQVQIRSVQGNGAVTTVDAGQDAICILGSDGQSAGLFLELPKLKQLLPLRAVPVPRPSEKPAEESKPPGPKTGG